MKIIFFIVPGPEGLLKLDIIVRKAAMVTYIWNFSENLENYKKVFLW